MTETRPLDLAGDRIQTVTTAGVAALAVGAFLLSYDALHQLARTSHVPTPLAWLWPLIVDGFIVVASLAVLQAVHTGRQAYYPWALVLAFSALSVTFNVLDAPPQLVARLVAAIPPLALVLSFELLMRQIHHRLHQTATTPPAEAATAPAAPARDHVPRITDATAATPAAATRDAAPPSPSGPTTKATRQPRAVTQARAEAVRDDCTRTGQPLTTAVLAERLDISDGYARRLLRDLNANPTAGQRSEADPGADRPVTGLRAVGP